MLESESCLQPGQGCKVPVSICTNKARSEEVFMDGMYLKPMCMYNEVSYVKMPSFPCLQIFGVRR